MINKKDIGFDFTKLNGMTKDEVAPIIPQMSCEELLTCRIVSNKQMVVHLINKELMERLEENDYVEVIRGLERVRRKCGNICYLEGRDYQRYGAKTLSFYIRDRYMDKLHDHYSCELQHVDWKATKTYDTESYLEQDKHYKLEVMTGKWDKKLEIVNQ